MRSMRATAKQSSYQKESFYGLWGVGFCFFSSLLFVTFQGGRLAYMLLMIVSALSLYLILGRWSGIAKAQGKRFIEEQGEAGGYRAGVSIPIKLTAHIPGYWPIPYVMIKEELVGHHGEAYTFEMTFVPDWKRNGEIRYYTPPLRRGIYHFAPTLSMTEDVFGLFRHHGTMQIEQTFFVMPQTVPIREWNLLARMMSGNHFHTISSKAARETTQINGVREYVYGDRISRIHWNATARTGTWKSKEFERESLPRTIILLDRQQGAYLNSELFELAVSATASICKFGSNRDLPLGLLADGKNVLFTPSGKGLHHASQLLEQLVTVEADGNERLESVLLRQIDRFTNGSFIIVISPRQGAELLELQRLFKSRQLNFCHIWLRPKAVAANERERLDLAKRLSAFDYATYPISQLQELPLVLGGNGR